MSRQDFVRLAAGADITGEKTLYCGTQQQWRSTWLMIPFDKILVLRPVNVNRAVAKRFANKKPERSEEHTSELQSLMRISYAVFCLKKKKKNNNKQTNI